RSLTGTCSAGVGTTRVVDTRNGPVGRRLRCAIVPEAFRKVVGEARGFLSRKGLRRGGLGLRWLGPGRRSVLSLRRCWLGACRRLGLLLVRGRARGCRRPGGGRAVLILSSPDRVGAVLGTTAASTPAAADGPPGPL